MVYLLFWLNSLLVKFVQKKFNVPGHWRHGGRFRHATFTRHESHRPVQLYVQCEKPGEVQDAKKTTIFTSHRSSDGHLTGAIYIQISIGHFERYSIVNRIRTVRSRQYWFSSIWARWNEINWPVRHFWLRMSPLASIYDVILNFILPDPSSRLKNIPDYIESSSLMTTVSSRQEKSIQFNLSNNNELNHYN